MLHSGSSGMSMAVAEGEGPPSHHAPTEPWCLLAGSCQPGAGQERDDARHILVGRPISHHPISHLMVGRPISHHHHQVQEGVCITQAPSAGWKAVVAVMYSEAILCIVYSLCSCPPLPPKPGPLFCPPPPPPRGSYLRNKPHVLRESMQQVRGPGSSYGAAS